MAMKDKKVVLAILLGVVIIGFSVIIISQLTERSGYLAVVRINTEIPLDDEQNQLLTDSILPSQLMELDEIEYRNAWLLLEAMRQIGFEEGRPAGQSGVALAARILYLLELGGFREVAVVQVISSHISPMSDLVLRAINTEGEIYYIRYNRTWGLGSVTGGAISVLEGGEAIFIRWITHAFDFEGNFIQIQRD